MKESESDISGRVSKDELIKIITVLSKGNPGAISVLLKMFHWVGGIIQTHLDALESMNLKGERIWILWKDVCKNNMDMLVAFLEDFSNGEVDAEDFNRQFADVASCGHEDSAALLRETYMDPAVHRFLDRQMAQAHGIKQEDVPKVETDAPG